MREEPTHEVPWFDLPETAVDIDSLCEFDKHVCEDLGIIQFLRPRHRCEDESYRSRGAKPHEYSGNSTLVTYVGPGIRVRQPVQGCKIYEAN